MRMSGPRRTAALIGALMSLLVVVGPTLAATQNEVWRTASRHADPKVVVGSTITVLADGKGATAAVKVYDSTGSTVNARICAGPCSGGNVIVAFPKFRVPASGVTRSWHRLTSTQSAALRTAIADKLTPTLEVSTSKGTAAPTILTSTYKLVK